MGQSPDDKNGIMVHADRVIDKGHPIGVIVGKEAAHSDSNHEEAKARLFPITMTTGKNKYEESHRVMMEIPSRKSYRDPLFMGMHLVKELNLEHRDPQKNEYCAEVHTNGIVTATKRIHKDGAVVIGRRSTMQELTRKQLESKSEPDSKQAVEHSRQVILRI